MHTQKKQTARRRAVGMMALAAAAGLSASARAAQIGDIFYIAMENHNFTQPGSVSSPEQIFDNPAAPYQTSLVTPGNANAADVSFATNYTNSGTGVHPSEPNYLWDEAGTNYNQATGTTVTFDTDPSTTVGNVFTNTPHLTGLMNSAGVTWKNYQEDVQFSSNPTLSASGTNTSFTNPYNGSHQYNYAVKHNPMAFFPDTAQQNVFPISQLQTDLNSNTVGQYNWITPNQFNDAHSALTGGFTYNGTHFTGDQAAIAQGDNFLAQIIPTIEASSAFKNNGAIVIWYDETEGGDTTAETLPEIVISPLAKGNAYDSTLPYNHSSDIKTLQEVFNLGTSYLNNTIPISEFSPAGGPGSVNTVQGSNDLSDMFVPGTAFSNALPEPTSLSLAGIAAAGLLRRRRRKA